MSAQARSDVRALLDRHGIAPAKHLGQHFLVDPNITRKIVSLAGVGPGDAVVEIGPGTGTLTAELAATGASVVAYEVDEGLRPVLDDVLSGTDVVVRYADAARADLASELDPGREWAMVANLPYNVGTPILLDSLRRVPQIMRFVVMVQVEVGERLVARPGSPAYGVPSVVVGIHARSRVEFKVPPQVFLPPPGVGSAVVVIDRQVAPAASERAIELAAAGFGQRRKMLRSSLRSVLDTPTDVLTEAGIPPTARAEELDPGAWVRLAEASR